MLSGISDAPSTYTRLTATSEPKLLFLQKQGVSSLSTSYWLGFSYLLFAGSVSKRIVLWMPRLAAVHCSGDPTISTTYSKIRIRTVPQIPCHTILWQNRVLHASMKTGKELNCTTVPDKFLWSHFTKCQPYYLKLNLFLDLQRQESCLKTPDRVSGQEISVTNIQCKLFSVALF